MEISNEQKAELKKELCNLFRRFFEEYNMDRVEINAKLNFEAHPGSRELDSCQCELDIHNHDSRNNR